MDEILIVRCTFTKQSLPANYVIVCRLILFINKKKYFFLSINQGIGHNIYGCNLFGIQLISGMAMPCCLIT